MARLRFDVSELALDPVLVGQNAQAAVTITANRGSTVVLSLVDDASGVFSCADAGEFSLAADESRTVTVSFTASSAGTYGATLQVQHKRRGRSAETCTLSAAAVASAPPTVDVSSLSLGDVATGSTTQGAVTVSTESNGDTYQLGARLEGGAAFLSSLASSTLSGGASTTVTVTFAPTSTGSQSDTLDIAWSRSGTVTESGELSVSVGGVGLAPTPEVRVSRGALDFGAALVGSSTDGAFVITAMTPITYALSIVGASASEYQLATTGASLAANAAETVTVTHLGNAAGVHDAAAVITDDGGVERGRVSLTAESLEADPPWIGNDITELDLGTETIGDTRTSTLTVYVEANGDTYTLAPSLSSGAAFSCSVTTDTAVASGGSLALTITFSPGAARIYDDNLMIDWSRSGEVSARGRLTIALTGEGERLDPEITLDPAALDFGTRLVSATSSLTSTVAAVTDIAFAATIEGDDADQFALVGSYAAVGLSADATKTVVVRHAPEAAGKHSATLVICDSDGVERGNCTLTGEAVASAYPWFANDVSELDVGTQFVGDTATGVATLESPANGDEYTFTPSIEDGSVFSCSVTSATTVDGGTALVLTITYAPSAVGTHGDALSIAWTRSGDVEESGTLEVSLQGKAVDESDLAGGEDADSTDVTGTGLDTTSQRATLLVPNPYTLLNLGASYLNATTDGFSLRTTSHVTMTAAEAVTFQANGITALTSTNDNAYVLAEKDAYLIAKKDVYVGGADLVGIFAGAAASPSSITTDADGNPQKPDEIDALTNRFLAAEVVSKTIVLTTQVANIMKMFWNGANLLDVSKQAKGLGLSVKSGFHTAATMTLAMSLYKVVDTAWWIHGKATGKPTQRLSVYGSTGVLMATPSFTSIAGLTGVTTMGTTLNLMGFATSTLEGVWSATVDGVGPTTVRAGVDISALTSWGARFGSRRGALTFQGKNVTVGGLGQPLSCSVKPPLPNASIAAYCLKSFSMTALTPVVSKCSVQTLGKFDVQVHSANGAQLKAGKTFKIANSFWVLECGPAGIAVRSAAGTEVAKLTPTSIAIGDGMGKLEMTPAMANLGPIKVLPAMAMVSATRVEIC